ncbi:MAG TPA: tripartite tricarboxylate transporter substrate-binding protein, partial [Burkholderiales bacterium]|nr:tripartite tricarboxylate transporter substrate-binding protein [Burkholderiales bacterium]
VPANFPASNAKEFLALVRANPGKYTFASSGTGATAHMFAELFNSMAQLKVVHIPYKGSVPALTDVISGQVGYAIETVAATSSFIKSGKLKTFGVTSARPSAALPGVPPLAEAADIPGYDCAAWIAYAAPAGTPREIVMKLAAEIQKAVQATDLRDRYVVLGMDTASNTPEEMIAYMRREQDRYASIIKNAGIKVE